MAFNLQDLVEEVLRAFALKAHQKKLELLGQIGPDVPEQVVGDSSRLRQILVNLIGNAIKFTHHGEVLVSAHCNQRNGRAVEIQFDVSDTGIGIPREKHSLIFEAFTQADGATTRNYGGTGLGLSIATQLAGMMGGRIWVKSAIGQGSTFSFTVQLEMASPSKTASVALLKDELLHLPVLIVDGNATNRRILVQMTKDWGMSPIAAESGSEALRLLNFARQNGAIRLAVIDRNMCGMDGFELAEQMKLDPQLARATIMMLTSPDFSGETARCKELGIDSYLMKPIRKSELLAAILGVLARQSASPVGLVTREILNEPSFCLRILVAEDNPINQTVILRLLQNLGHNPTTVGNGQEALRALAQEHFDLVLMDVQMPQMDGLSATKEIRNTERTTGNHVPIVALTANVMQGDADVCVAAGMDAYLSKPVSRKSLEEVFANLLPGETRTIATPAPK
ncbi:MAG TPA: response regulator [Candidatus Angelobacter sp.]|nr:response regulator [Candidatus Angelobacter sp.]